jgi:beta-lactamase regulating signal transducer with metallopeptidase domain
MATSKIEDRVLRAKEKLEKLKAENLASIQAAKKNLTDLEKQQNKAEKERLAAIAEAERKADSHRKIIVGVVALHGMAQDSDFKRSMQNFAKSCLTSPDDLALFEAL